MATTGQQIVDQGRILLQDVTTGGVRWLDSEMLIWVNAGQREIALYKPDASVVNASSQLIAGTKQALPSGGNLLIKIMRNTGADGLTPGRAIRIVDQEVLDAQNPEWHTDAAANEVKHYLFDRRNPTAFYVYPAQPDVTPSYVEMVYASSPAELVTLAGDLNILDIYSNALVNFIVYRALSKDATYTKQGVDAEIYYRNFLGAVGALDMNQQNFDPNRLIGNPNSNFQAGVEDGPIQ